MKKVLLVLLICLFLGGCASTPILYNKFPCYKSQDEVTSEITKICREEGLSPYNEVVIDKGCLYFKQDNVKSVASISYFFTWKFYFNSNNEILAYPKYNCPGGYSIWIGRYPERYSICGDNTAEEYTEYWNVRAKLEKLCGYKAIIIIEDENKKSMKYQSIQDENKKSIRNDEDNYIIKYQKEKELERSKGWKK